MRNVVVLLAVMLAIMMIPTSVGVDAKPAERQDERPERPDSILPYLEMAMNDVIGPDSEKVTRGQIVAALKEAYMNQGPGVQLKNFGHLLHIGEILSFEDMVMDEDDPVTPAGITFEDDGRGGVKANIGVYWVEHTEKVDEDGTVLSNNIHHCVSIGTSSSDWVWF